MSDIEFMRLALRLARRGRGNTSPNPMVGAVVVKGGDIIGRGWHRRAGAPHAEIEALQDAQRRGHNAQGATLYVTLEPCCTQGRTPPCTSAIIAAGIKHVVVGATDSNPAHAGKGYMLLQRLGVKVTKGILEDDCSRLNEAFNHWIVHHTPFVTVKAAMTLDGKIATASGESKWITGEKARAQGMNLRRSCDAILVGVNTVLADNPSLTVRTKKRVGGLKNIKPIRRIILDSLARTPLTAKVMVDPYRAHTTIVVGKRAPKKRVAALRRHVNVLIAPPMKTSARSTLRAAIDLQWLMKKLAAENVASLLVEGGGEVNASFLLSGCTQRVAFFYAPKILGGHNSRKAVAGKGSQGLHEIIPLHDIHWRRLGSDLLFTARIS